MCQRFSRVMHTLYCWKKEGIQPMFSVDGPPADPSRGCGGGSLFERKRRGGIGVTIFMTTRQAVLYIIF